MPPIALASSPSIHFRWSGDGKYVLIIREPEIRSGEIARAAHNGTKLPRIVEVCETKTGKLTKIDTPGFVSSGLLDYLAVGNKGDFLLFYELPTDENSLPINTSVFMVSGSKPVPKRLMQGVRRSPEFVPQASPIQDIFVIIDSLADKSIIIRQFNLAGKNTMTTLVPKGKEEVRITGLLWDKNGTPYCESIKRGPDRKPIISLYQLSPSGLSEVDKSTVDLYEEQDKELTVVSTLVPFPKQTGLSNMNWVGINSRMPSDYSNAIVTTNGLMPELSPTLSAVAYVAESTLFIRPMLKLSISEFDEIIKKIEITRAMNKAREVGTAILLYGSDNDDSLPDGDLNDQLSQYLTNPDTLKNFTPSFERGINQSKIDSPSTYELGFVRGPGGRAVIFADGHSKWIPDKSS